MTTGFSTITTLEDHFKLTLSRLELREKRNRVIAGDTTAMAGSSASLTGEPAGDESRIAGDDRAGWGRNGCPKSAGCTI
jgi:hypothetical protein